MSLKRRRECDENDPPSNSNFEFGGVLSKYTKREEVNFYTPEVVARLFQVANIAHLLPHLEFCETRAQLKKKLVALAIGAGAGVAIRAIFVQIHCEESLEIIRRQFEAREINQEEAEEATHSAQALYFRDNKRYVPSS